MDVHKLNDAAAPSNEKVRGDAQFGNLAEEWVRRRVEPICKQRLHRAAAEASGRQRNVVDHEKIHWIGAAAFIRIGRETTPRAPVPAVCRVTPERAPTLHAASHAHLMPSR